MIVPTRALAAAAVALLAIGWREAQFFFARNAARVALLTAATVVACAARSRCSRF